MATALLSTREMQRCMCESAQQRAERCGTEKHLGAAQAPRGVFGVNMHRASKKTVSEDELCPVAPFRENTKTR